MNFKRKINRELKSGFEIFLTSLKEVLGDIDRLFNFSGVMNMCKKLASTGESAGTINFKSLKKLTDKVKHSYTRMFDLSSFKRSFRNMFYVTAIFSVGFFGCDDSDYVYVDYPPDAPQGLLSITGDGKATLFWDHNLEEDFYKYALYTSDSENGTYYIDGETYDNSYVFHFQNGETRFLAVAAMDIEGNESELSYEVVWDTPRPEGRNYSVRPLFYDEWDTNYERCGLDFSDYDDQMIQSIDNPSNDVFVDNFEGTVYFNAFDVDTDIADLGPTNKLSDVDFIEPDMIDWDLEGYLQLFEDHAYLVWTYDNHFAVFRVREVYQDEVLFDWAYQTDEGNPQLKIGSGGPESLNGGLLKKLGELKKIKSDSRSKVKVSREEMINKIYSLKKTKKGGQ